MELTSRSMIDLEPEYLAEICQILQQQVPECEVRAYGSRVTGGAWKYSDLDLALVAPNGAVPWRRLAHLKDLFAISDLPILVEIHDWADISPYFQNIILQHYAVIKSAQQPP